MLIYILHDDKIVPFKLPKEVSGSFILTDYDVNGISRNLITIEANNGKWIGSSTTDVKIMENKKNVNSIELSTYKFYQLVIYGTEVVWIYTLPAYENEMSLLGLGNFDKITIGTDGDSDIIFNYNCISPKQLEITKVGGGYFINNLNPKIPVYVNKVRMDRGFLFNLDTIFVMGFKMILCGNNFLVNKPYLLGLSFSKKFIKPSAYPIAKNYDSTGKTYRNFYEEKEYFSKSPIFQVKLEHYEVSFASPPGISDKSNEKQSTTLTIVPTALMSITSLVSAYYVVQNYSKGKATKEDLITNLIMCAAMLVAGILWPFIENIIGLIRHKLFFKKVKRKYMKYLKRKDEEIEKLLNKQKIVLTTNFISIDECVDSVYRRTPNLFSRHIGSPDFLKVRLGMGDFPFDCKFKYDKPDFSMEDTSLYDSIEKIVKKYEYIKDVPINFSLSENNIAGFISSQKHCYDYAYAILLQILALHGYDELKVVVLTDDTGKEKLKFMKNLNHVWDKKHKLRLFVDNVDADQDVFNYLDSVLADEKRKIDEYYLIVTDCIDKYSNNPIINKILDSEKNNGVSILAFDDDVNKMPSQCKYFVNYDYKEASVFQKEMGNDKIIKFKPEFIYDEHRHYDINNFASTLANIPLKKKADDEEGNLTASLGFLEMYGVGNVDQLNAGIKWDEDGIINSLSVPIGVDAHNNLVYLDLHEKRHGPHGLIAGMTGSGKSEFIVTFVLSLAVNFSPEEAQFVLIDYKGGGLAGAFENRKTGIKLPHLAGTITNLDKSEMNRTLVSIQSELQRRQKLFNEAKEKLNIGTIDIYKYQQLHREKKLDNTVSHLFIICDEFAELKAQQPDFMDQLVSTARIGRSLGVHLILATQKPSGVVDDQIWSNSKFKVCCKVQTAEDSNEMIRKPDAAYLTEAGRFYLQVGYDQYFILGQSAYSGTKYVPSNKTKTSTDDSIEFINYIGENIKTIHEEVEVVDSEDHGEELTNVLNYLIKVAENKKVSSQKLWLDNIPDHIYLDNLQEKYKQNYAIQKNILNPIIGEYDDPEHQSQGLVTLPITTGGNCYIAGDAGCGKTTLLSTILYSIITTHLTNEVNIYIIDYGAETLKRFKSAPQVADVITQETADKIPVLFNRIKKEIQDRKDKLAAAGSDYLTYIKNEKNTDMPNWLVILNGMDAFNDSFNDFVMDEFPAILRESNKYGISLVITSITYNSIGYANLAQMPQKIPLRFAETDNYASLIDTKMVPSTNPGRGLIEIGENVYQFQTALIFKEEVATDNLNYVINALVEKIPSKLQSIPVLPDMVSVKDLGIKEYNFSNIPVGLDIGTILPVTFSFENYVNFIVSNSEASLVKFMNGLLKSMLGAGKVRAIVLDGTGSFRIKYKDENVKYYNSDFDQIIPFLKQTCDKYGTEEHTERIPIFVIGCSSIVDELEDKKSSDEKLISFNDFMISCKDSKVFKFIFVTTDIMASTWESYEWYQLCNSKYGIYFGDDFESQEIITAKKVVDEYKVHLDNTNATVVNNAEKTFIKYIVE